MDLSDAPITGIERQNDTQDARRREKKRPLRRLAEEAAERHRAQGTGCHVRRWHRGEWGWFVVGDADYARLARVDQPEHTHD